MKERDFIIKNKEEWQSIEAKLKNRSYHDPDEITHDYIRITEDLSYAHSFYSDSSIVEYLNSLSVQLHQVINPSKRYSYKDSVREFFESIPLAIGEIRKEINLSALVFCLAIFLGFMSSQKDDTFNQLILGAGYVNMTNENIDNEDPLAVYASSDEGMMSFMIGVNNIFVAVRTFLFGILFGIGSVFILVYNGIMVGSFFHLFYPPDLIWLALTTIMLHGTIELWLIIVAGATGIHLGLSFLFPGTYSRFRALKNAAKRSLKVLIGLVPFFILAALIESYVTRHYMALGYIGRIGIILFSITLIYLYFYFFPQIIKIKKNYDEEQPEIQR